MAIGPGTADPYGPKAVRASMGAIFAMPVARFGPQAAAPSPGHSVIQPLADEAIASLPSPTIALAARQGEPLRGPIEKGTLLVGAEREGLPAEALAAADRLAHIPIRSESLNAAMAATVALYEAVRYN